MLIIVCHLDAIMREKGLTVKRLSQRSGVARETITRLVNNGFERIRIDVIAKILAALGSTSMDDIFEVYDANALFAIRLAQEVTFHLGSEWIAEHDTLPEGVRTIRAMSLIEEELYRSTAGVRVHVRVHARRDPGLGEAARAIREEGNHFILGSPLANQLAEEVVCGAYDVPPYSPHRRGEIPFAFKWGEERAVQSSFGIQATNGELGIVSTRTGELLAAHTTVPEGQGETCALIMVDRVWRAPARRRYGRHDENIVVVVAGYDDLGIEGAALALLNPAFSRELYPERASSPYTRAPLMRVVSVSYVRPPGPSPQDNRQIVSVRLVT